MYMSLVTTNAITLSPTFHPPSGAGTVVEKPITLFSCVNSNVVRYILAFVRVTSIRTVAGDLSLFVTGCANAERSVVSIDISLKYPYSICELEYSRNVNSVADAGAGDGAPVNT